MKRVILTFLVLIFVSSILTAQQEPQFSHHMFTNMAINPGYAGMNGSICATADFRQQWVGFQQYDEKGESVSGSPQTILLTVDGPVNPLHGGLGLSIYQDKIGWSSSLNLKLSYAFHLRNVGPGTLGIGLQGGFLNQSYDFSKFDPGLEPGEQGYVADPALLAQANDQSDMLIDFGFGLYYKIPNKAYVGLSTSQLSESESSYEALLAAPKLKRHYYFTAGYEYTLPGNPNFVLKPSLFINSTLTSTQYNLSCLTEFKEKFWGGLGYRSTDAIIVLLGMRPLKNLAVGYSYDITTSQMGGSGRSSGTHEIFVNYCFDITFPTYETSSKTVRFL